MTKFTWLTLVSLLLSACASVPSLPPEQMTKSYGYVTGQLVTNAPGVSAFIARFSMMEVVDEKGEKFFLSDTNPGGRYSQTFAGWLPPGTYQVNRLVGMVGSMSAEMRGVSTMLGTFKVSVGGHTDLGTLMFQPVERNAATVLPLKDQRQDAELGLSLPPPVAKVVSDKPQRANWSPKLPIPTSTTWTSNNSGYGGLIGGLIIDAITINADSKSGTNRQLRWSEVKDVSEIDLLTKRSTVNLNAGSEKADGKAVFGSRLGVLLMREPNGQWQAEDTSTHSEITATLYDDALLAIGTENGRIGLRKASGWEFFTVARNDQALVFMSRESAGTVLVASLAPVAGKQTLELFRLNLADRAVASLGTVELNSSSFMSPQPFHAGDYIARVGRQILVGQDADTLAIFDLDTGKWRNEKSPDSFQRLHSNPAETVAVLVDNFGVTRNQFIKTPESKWLNFDAPRLLLDIQFLDAQRGFGTILKFGSGGGTVIHTEDGGKTWKEVGAQIPEPCLSFKLLQHSRRMLCSTTTGTLMTSSDGDKWDVERRLR